MSLVITKGYLINKIDYEVFDEVITFINEYGNHFSCLARGVKKINSKNARSLFIGNFNEFEFFNARAENKVSKLKRSNTIIQVEWELYQRLSFRVLNELTYKIGDNDIKLFYYYQRNLENIKNKKFVDELLVLIILIESTFILGIELETKRCVNCYSNKIKTFSFSEHGFICNLCFQPTKHKIYDLSLLKLIKSLCEEDYENAIKFSNQYSYLIKLLKNYLNDYGGINLTSLSTY